MWSAYALADLSPPWRKHTDWFVNGDSLLLVYAGLSPPVLFGVGEPDELYDLFRELSPGRYWYTLRPTDFALLEERLEKYSRSRMWRMTLTEKSFDEKFDEVIRLRVDQQELVDQLYAAHPDRPDAYHPDQIQQGVYYGVFDGSNLVSVAGTHVLDRELGVAALGNVFTSPDHRRRGYGRKTTAAVVEHLVELGIDTVVLNVEMKNQIAIELYRGLGFVPYCGFYEGTAVLF